MGVGHVMQCDAGHICDGTLRVGLGLGRCRAGFRTEGRMSHNNEALYGHVLVLCCAMLCYIVLCCAMLCYAARAGSIMCYRQGVFPMVLFVL